MIKGSYVCRGNWELNSGVFRCLVGCDDNFSENLAAAVAFCFNGPVLCHRGKLFQKVVMCGCGDGQLVLVFYSPQCHASTSWRAADSQSSVQLVLRVGGSRGELDCDG